MHQRLAHTREDVEAFVGTIERSGSAFKAVVKPVEGAGSDGVSICNSAEEVRAAFGRLEGTKNILGLDNYAVLCQEFLAGDEYVVDSVSRAGEHKVVALWKYDKRDYYGSPVVYHGMQLLNVESDPSLLAAMVAYVTTVLDAMGVTDGAMHTEVTRLRCACDAMQPCTRTAAALGARGYSRGGCTRLSVRRCAMLPGDGLAVVAR